MELQQLRYFREVAEREHMTRAAESLFVSQSAISRAVTQLEEELGVPLFYRQGRAVILSPYGRLFLEHVVRALNVLETGKRVLEECSSAESGTITLGFLHSLGSEMVPRLIKEYRQNHSEVQFRLVQRSGKMVMQDLVEGAVDLCLSVPGMFDQTGIRWTHLLDEELVVAMSQTHRLATRRTLRISELSCEQFLALTPGHTLRVLFDKLCSDASFVPGIVFEAMDIGTLRGMTAVGLGISLLPHAPARVSGIVEIKLSQARPSRPLGIGWVDERYLPPCAVQFRDFVVAKFTRN
jgi:LysR family transcriptional regulator, transcription activator of glutamate synthase operon